MELYNYRGQQNTITKALQVEIPEHAVISITGSGGKTSLMFAWASELAASGKRVIITTTTRMGRGFRPVEEGITVSAEDDPEKPGKAKGPGIDAIESMRNDYDVILIEADGSRRKPLKWPAPWEPVVPDFTDITVFVAGLSGLGQKTSDAIYRADELPDNLKRDIVDVNLMHAIASSRNGGQKGARGEFRIFLNQVDDDTDRLAAAYRMQQIFAVMGIQSAWGSLRHGNNTKLAVILEAAGSSSRFGSNKLLYLMEDGRPMISPVLEAVRGIDAYKKILVTQYDEVAALADGFDIVMNDRPDLGISRSMQLGIEAAGDADAYMFCVCDQPGIKTSTLTGLIDSYKKGTAGIVSLAWQGKMCNPKIFSARYRAELMDLSGDTGGRQIISAHSSDLVLSEAECEEEIRDIDSL